MYIKLHTFTAAQVFTISYIISQWATGLCVGSRSECRAFINQCIKHTQSDMLSQLRLPQVKTQATLW